MNKEYLDEETLYTEECCDCPEYYDDYGLDEDELEEKLLDLITIPLDVDNLSDLTLNKDNFKKGINKVSEIAGMFVALKNVGMNPDMAYDMVKNLTNINAQLSIQDKVCNMEITCAKEETAKKVSL